MVKDGNRARREGWAPKTYIPCSISFLLSSCIARILFIFAGGEGLRLWGCGEQARRCFWYQAKSMGRLDSYAACED